MRRRVFIQSRLPVRLDVFVGHRMRCVDGVRRDIGEEPVASILPDELHGRVEENVRAVPLRLDGPSVPPESRIEPRVGMIGRLPHAARLQDEGLLEALVLRAHRIGVAEVPLAEDSRAVAGVPQHFRDCYLVAVHLRAPRDVWMTPVW